MQLSKEIKQAFLEELLALFKKHHAEVCIELETKISTEGVACTGAHLNVCMVERSGPNGEKLNQFTEFNLDNHDIAHWRRFR